MKDISVIGCGRWGTFLAWYAANRCPGKINNVLMYDLKTSPNFIELQNTRKNEYLSLSDNMHLFDTLDKVDTSYNSTETDLFENGLPDEDSVDPNDALAPAHRVDDTEEDSLEVEDEDLVEERYEVDDDDDLYNFDEEDN